MSFRQSVWHITYIAVTGEQLVVPVFAPVVLVVLVTTGGADVFRQLQALEMREGPYEVGALLGSGDFGVAR